MSTPSGTVSQESLVDGLNTSQMNDEGTNLIHEKLNIFDLANEIEDKLNTLVKMVDKEDTETDKKLDNLLKKLVNLENELK